MIQWDPCNSNSYNSKNHLNRTDLSDPCLINSYKKTPITRKSCNSNNFLGPLQFGLHDYVLEGRVCGVYEIFFYGIFQKNHGLILLTGL